MPQLLSGDPEVLATEAGQRWYGELTSGDLDRIFATAMEIVGSLSGDEPPIESETSVRNAWQAYTALADRYNDPGTFTTIIGFEWTAIGGYNLHRNVLFRGDAGVADQTLPFSQYDSKNPEDLWTWMEDFEDAHRLGRARHPAQRQPLERPHVHGGELRRPAADAPSSPRGASATSR